jgi:hypothetical protein
MISISFEVIYFCIGRILSLDCVTVDRVWIGNQIYLTFEHMTTLYSSLLHTSFLGYTLHLSSRNGQNYVTTNGQSVSLSCCQAPIWGPIPGSCYYEY